MSASISQYVKLVLLKELYFDWFNESPDKIYFSLSNVNLSVKLLAFAPLFNAKKHVLNYFALEMAAIIFPKRRHLREQR